MSSERLTSRNEKGDLFYDGKQVYAGHLYNAVEQLEEYEDLQDENRLIELPYADGTDVWYPWCGEVIKDNIIGYLYSDRAGLIVLLQGRDGVTPSEIGKTVFLTRSAAESALAERSGNE